MKNKFRYEIYETNQANPFSFPINVRDVYPIDEAEFIVTETKSNGKIYYVKEIKNKIKLSPVDFGHYYSQLTACYKYWVLIYKFCDNQWKQIYKCYFNQINITYDLDRCTAEIDLKDSSVYNCFNDRRSTSVNIFQGNPFFQIVFTGNVNELQPLTYPPAPACLFRVLDFQYATAQVLGAVACCDDVGCYFTPISDFFGWLYDSMGNPIQQMAQPASNYVHPGPGYWIYIAAKADVKDSCASNPTTNFPMTFDDLETIMSDVFNVYWIIDGGYIRFEHYSWFQQNVNYDTTIATNAPMNEFNRKFAFDTDKLPSSETFKYSERNNSPFLDNSIIYSEDCGVNGKDVERGPKNGTADFGYVALSPGAIDSHGFVLCDVYESGGYLHLYNDGTGDNDRLGWVKALYNLHRHNRPFRSGIMNGNPEIFLSPVYDKVQTDSKFQICCTDPYEKYQSLVRTFLGLGAIEEAVVNYSKEIITFKTKHDKIV